MVVNPPAQSRITLGAVSLGLLLSLPSRAEAAGCVPSNINVLAPADGAVNVPINARLWMGGNAPKPSLSDASGRQVAGTVTTLRSRGGFVVQVFTPSAPLTPGATYVGDGANGRTTFTVGTEEDLNPPAVPVVTSRQQLAGPNASPGLGGGIRDQTPPRLLTLGVSGQKVVILADIDKTSTFASSVPEGLVSALGSDDALDIGRTDCIKNWDGIANMAVRLGTFDVAGNFSGWSEESSEVVEVVEVVETEGCSCTNSSASYSGGWVLGALGLGLLRRFRARSTARSEV